MTGLIRQEKGDEGEKTVNEGVDRFEMGLGGCFLFRLFFSQSCQFFDYINCKD